MSEKLSSSVPEFRPTPEVEKPADRFRVDPQDYPIFCKQYELDTRWGNNTPHYYNIDKTLSRFVTSTADLIATLDGTSIEYEDNHELTPPDHVIYLDKSARPVSWLVSTFWQDFSENERPKHSYLNIDRQPWFRRSGVQLDANGYSQNPDGTPHRNSFADFKTENISPTDFARIRALYLPGGIEDEDPEKIMRTPSTLDGKNILIVDEVKRSGATADIAKWLVEHAFPEATSVRTAYFWRSGFKTSPDGTEHQMLSVPVWYDSKSSLGRGIGDINPEFFQKRHEQFNTPRTRAQNFGSIVLGAYTDLSKEPHNQSRELMHEIQQMHQDYQDGKILLRFPRNYDDDRAADLIEAQGVRLAPISDKSPDTYLNIVKAIDLRPPSI